MKAYETGKRRFWSDVVVVADGFDKTGDVVTGSFDVDRETEVAHRLRRDRSDGGGLQPGRHRKLKAHEVLGGGGTGEGDEVRAFVAETFNSASEIVCFGNGAIGGNDVHDGAELGEFIGQDVAGLFGAGEEKGLVLD